MNPCDGFAIAIDDRFAIIEVNHFVIHPVHDFASRNRLGPDLGIPRAIPLRGIVPPSAGNGQSNEHKNERIEVSSMSE